MEMYPLDDIIYFKQTVLKVISFNISIYDYPLSLNFCCLGGT